MDEKCEKKRIRSGFYNLNGRTEREWRGIWTRGRKKEPSSATITRIIIEIISLLQEKEKGEQKVTGRKGERGERTVTPS